MSSSIEPETTTVNDATWRPTRAGTAVTGLLTMVLTALVAVALDLIFALGAAVMTAVSLGGAIWFATRFRWKLVGRFFAGVLISLFGLGTTLGLLYTGVTLSGTLFPQPTIAQSATAILTMVAQLAVVFGVTIAVIGAVSCTSGLLDRSTLQTVWGIAVQTATPLFLGAVGLAAFAVVGKVQLQSLNQTVESTVRTGIQEGVSLLLAPTSSHPSLTSLAGLLLITVWLLNTAIRTLPLAELLGADRTEPLHAVQTLTARVLAASALGIPVGLCTDYLLPAEIIRQKVSPSAYRLLVEVTAFEPIRGGLLGLSVVSLLLILVTITLKWVATRSPGNATTRFAPIGSGFILGGLALVLHSQLVWRVQDFIIENLPRTVTGRYQRLSESVIQYYGTLTVTIVAFLLFLLVAVGVILMLRTSIWMRIIPNTTTGPALAGAGLFLATAFGGTQSLQPALIFVGILGSFVAWDAGRFAWILGQEVGRHAPTYKVEAVHLSGTILVGGIAILLAAMTLSYATEITVINPATVQATAVGVAGSLFMLVFATR